MRGLGIALGLVVAGCGRVGFDETPRAVVDAASADGPTCPPTYSALPEGCFRLSATGATTSAAEAACELDGGHLAVITSTAENAALTTLGGASSAWIGVANVGAGFVSITTGVPPTFTRWAPGDPNGEGDCVRLLGGGSGTWDDEPCTRVQRYLCEIDGDGAVVVVP